MRKQILGTLIAIMSLLVIPGVLAATSITIPLDNKGVTGSTQLIEVSETGANLIVNVTFYYKTATGNWIMIDSVINDTIQDTQFNITWDTTGITDQGSITINATASTGVAPGTFFDDDTNVGIDIDNTLPTTSYGTNNPTNKFETDSTSITFDTKSDASVVNCTLTTDPAINGTSSFFDTASSNICEIVVPNIKDGSYGYYWTTRDNLNTSTMSERYVTIDTTKIGYVPPEDVDGKVPTKTDTKTIVIGLGILIIIGLWYNSKK